MVLSNKMMNSQTTPEDPSPLPLALMKKTPLLPSLSARAQFASITKSFFSKAFPSPPKNLWRLQNSPTGVDDPTDSSMVSDDQDDEAARGEICEIIVVAIQKVTDASTRVEAEDRDDGSSAVGPGKLRRTSIWGSARWTQGQLQLPHRMACTVRSGATTKVSAQPERIDNEFNFDEKFVFERRENDAQYSQVTIEASSVGFGKKYCLGQVAVDLDAAFAAQATGPIYRHSTLTTADGSESGIEIHYVLHRLVVENATAAAASHTLTRSSTSLNDDEDMDACGQIFPDLWYLC